MNRFADYKLGESSEQLEITTRQENADAAVALVRQCKLKVAIISKELDPSVYEQLDFVESIKRLALGGRHVDIRILVLEPELIVHRGHKLLYLVDKISSFIEIRTPNSEYDGFNEAIMIVDELGYLFRKNLEGYQGIVNFNNQRESKYLLSVFNSMWECANLDPNLRRMSL